MSFHKFIICLVPFTFIFISCDNEKDVKSYYTNSRNSNLVDTLIYSCPENDDYQIWIISSNKTGTLIRTKRLNSKNKVIDELLEKITHNGSQLISYTFFDYHNNSSNSIKFYPKEKDLMKWRVNESSKYSGEFTYHGTIFNFERTRSFYKKKMDTLIFLDKYSIIPMHKHQSLISCTLFGDNVENNNNYITFNQKSYFKKGYGMVKFERVYQNKKLITYNLKNN